MRVGVVKMRSWKVQGTRRGFAPRCKSTSRSFEHNEGAFREETILVLS